MLTNHENNFLQTLSWVQNTLDISKTVTTTDSQPKLSKCQKKKKKWRIQNSSYLCSPVVFIKLTRTSLATVPPPPSKSGGKKVADCDLNVYSTQPNEQSFNVWNVSDRQLFAVGPGLVRRGMSLLEGDLFCCFLGPVQPAGVLFTRPGSWVPTPQICPSNGASFRPPLGPPCLLPSATSHSPQR